MGVIMQCALWFGVRQPCALANEHEERLCGKVVLFKPVQESISLGSVDVIGEF